MKTRVAVVPDLNCNEQIEGIANTAGAYAGAVTTAVVGGIGTLLNGLFRGAVAGAQVTYQNMGRQEVEVQNTSIGARQQNQQQLPQRQPVQQQFTPAPEPLEITESEVAAIMRMRQECAIR